ncbi:hypothetical protein ID0624_10590 [Helicobacter pylori]
MPFGIIFITSNSDNPIIQFKAILVKAILVKAILVKAILVKAILVRIERKVRV